MSKLIRLKVIPLLLSILLIGCSASPAGQRKFGADADYFIGLQMLKNGNVNQAIIKFKNCAKKGTYYCAQKSAIELCSLGSVQERNAAASLLLEKFSDSDSLLAAVKQFYSADEISKVIEITDNINFEKEYNQTIKLRIEALKKRGDSTYSAQLYKWFTCKKISEFHFQFYKTYLRDIYESIEAEKLQPEEIVIKARINVYRRNYVPAYTDSFKILNLCENNVIECNKYLASDIGKAFLYGNTSYLQNADFLKALALKKTGNSAEFYFWFYAARLYEKLPNYTKSTSLCYTNAVETACDNELRDTAIWYLLNSNLKNPTETLISQILYYSKKWTDAEYFEDFFEGFSVSLLAGGMYNQFEKLYKELDGYATNETIAQYAYIYGRLAETGYIKATSEQIQAAFERATKSGSLIYYSILAANKLNYSTEQLKELLFTPKSAENETVKDMAAEKLLEGYAVFGFPELIYENYLDLRSNGISAKTAFLISDFLKKCANESNNYYSQSLRIASKAVNSAETKISENNYKLFFPDDFSPFVFEACEKYKLDPAIMFALIRSESFFDSTIKSSVGAIGLTQLMAATGSDIARKLKIKEYDLNQPETNINFGAFYYDELYRRCDNSFLQAFFSYNAGISRVRRWLKGSLVDIGKMQNLPGDLLLEAIPYTETRGYGRKLVSASVMYKVLYVEKADFKKFLKTILK